MKALFAVAGVDYLQWKAVSRTLLRTDFRAPTSHGGESYSLRSIGGLLMSALVFGMFGLATVPLIALNADVRLTGTLTLTYLTFALVTALLTQQGATMLTSADHAILGCRPVTSRTVLAIRLTNVLFHTLVITAFVSIAPVLAYTLAHGVSAGRGLGGFAAIFAWAIAVTCVIVASYAALIRWVGPTRLQRAVAYLQMVTGIAAYGGILLASRLFDRTTVTTATLPDTPWLLLLPPAWFVSYVEIGQGTASAHAWVRAALSLTLIGALMVLLRGKLALEYSARVAALGGEAVDPNSRAVRASGRTRVFSRNEARAVALLTMAHFRHDMRVRMALFGMAPLALVYLLLGAGEGNTDPFVAETSDGAPDLLALAALLFPALITRHLEASDAWRASWIYTVTTADHARLIVALKNVAALYFLGPFTVLTAALFSWRFGNALHGVAHAMLLGGLGYVALQTAVALNPRLPFAHPPGKSSSGALFGWLVFVMIGGQLLVLGLQRYVYPHWDRIALCALGLAFVSMLLERAVRLRVAHRSR